MDKMITLLIDADDTLWHNNIYYEQAIKTYIGMMENLGFCRHSIEEFVRRREMENVQHYGYGSYSFTMTMREVYQEICQQGGIKTEDCILAEIENHGRTTREYPIDLLPGVEETLPLLARHFTLIMVTKGNNEEQWNKIKRSGIHGHFAHHIVVPEKNEAVYREIVEKHDLNPETTWMIGNSPKSDINPAKMAGLRTALIPYMATWEFENAEIISVGIETVILKDFSELASMLGLVAA